MTKKLIENVLMILRHDGYPIGKFETEHDMTKGTLSKYASGHRKGISIDIAFWIADDLGYSVDEILNTNWTDVFKEADKKNEIKELEAQQEKIAERLAELRR